MKTKHYRLLILCCLFAVSCQKPTTDAQIAEDPHVYYDSNNCMHLDGQCKHLLNDPKHIKVRVNKSNERLQISYGHKRYMCNKCVTDSRYNQFLNFPKNPK